MVSNISNLVLGFEVLSTIFLIISVDIGADIADFDGRY